jgi:hypothetical protein
MGLERRSESDISSPLRIANLEIGGDGSFFRGAMLVSFLLFAPYSTDKQRQLKGATTT